MASFIKMINKDYYNYLRKQYFCIFEDQNFIESVVKVLKTGTCVAASIMSCQLAVIVSPLFIVDIRKKIHKELMHGDIEFCDKHSQSGMV